MKKKSVLPAGAGAHLGIDLAKDKFDCALRLFAAGVAEEFHRQSFANDAAGLKALSRWLAQHRCKKLTVVMEATGVYWELCAEWLHGRGHTVHVLNPAQARRFAQSQLCRNKTDAVDAALLCRMAQLSVQCAFIVWTPPQAELKVLRQLARGRQGLVVQRAGLRTQWLDCRNAEVRNALSGAIKALSIHIKALEKAMRAHVQEHPEVQQEVALLDSIPGLDWLSAAVILGEMAPLKGAEVRQVVAYAGLNPRQWQSGKSVSAPSRLSKVGNARLRHALYMPAVTGWTCNPILRAFGQRLLARGKKKMQMIGALMHKLLALCCGVLKTRTAFHALWREQKPLEPTFSLAN